MIGTDINASRDDIWSIVFRWNALAHLLFHLAWEIDKFLFETYACFYPINWVKEMTVYLSAKKLELTSFETLCAVLLIAITLLLPNIMLQTFYV